MTVSRLLKSCAIPPVSWPTLSSRCAWLSASSRLHALQAAREQVGERFDEAHLVVAELARLARANREDPDGAPEVGDRHRDRARQPGVEIRALHGEPALGRVVGNDHRAALGEDEAERGVGAIGDQLGDRLARQLTRHAGDAQLETARLQQIDARHIDLERLGGDLGHAVEQHLRIARVDREPPDAGRDIRCSARAAAPA